MHNKDIKCEKYHNTDEIDGMDRAIALESKRSHSHLII